MSQCLPTGGSRPLIFSDHQGFDRRWFAANLQAVYVPTRIDQVTEFVGAALSTYGSHVRIASGRHCYENFVYSPETQAIIDMSALHQVGFDPERNAYFADAGCENWTVYRSLLNGFGKTLPAGSCYSVGAGGHITGGGYGLLSRLHGLTVDHLSAVDIVTWDARARKAQFRHVSASSGDQAERDLFWALCGGGGGNFGVIVRYYFAELPNAPQHASLWTVAWDWSDIDPTAFGQLLAEYADMVSVMPDTDFSLLKLNHEAQGQIVLVYQAASADGSEHSKHCRLAENTVDHVKKRFAKIAPTKPMRRLCGGHPGFLSVLPTSENVQHLTYLEALQTLNGSGPNQFGKYKSAYMKKAFPDNQVEAIYQWLHTIPPGLSASDMEQSLVQVDSYGGRINQRSPEATPVPQRSSIMKLQYQTYWNNASQPGQSHVSPYREQEAAHVGWINDFYQAVYAEYGGTPDPAKDSKGVVDGCYYNYPDSSLGTHADGKLSQALWLYFLNNYKNNPRNLLQIKRHWDPENMFRHPQSIG